MNTYKRHRFPAEIISYAVWLYYRFKDKLDKVQVLVDASQFVTTKERTSSGSQRVRHHAEDGRLFGVNRMSITDAAAHGQISQCGIVNSRLD